ncbi:major capsid protein VP54 [Paramecium bursaria Chlorella virus OR0704.2.2]|nr:major capsid protein VP54 [Paramecium bursaria Chlorella virus OR0704.2.2]
MTGALTQLVAYGAQDVYLTGDPKMTFWKSVFTRYRNFALESIEQDIVGGIVSNGDISVTLSRSGDLIYAIMFEIEFQRGPSQPNDPLPYFSCEQWLKHIELYIGGQKVYEFGHEWFRMYWELFYNLEEEIAYNTMCNWTNEPEGYIRTFFLPIPVWFNATDPGRALPLIALQYHDVQFKIKLNNINNIPGINPNFIPTMRCFADYTFLDTQERIWFAQNPHEYIIQQVQTNQFPINVGPNQLNFNFDLNFNHPVKALMWACTPGSTTHGQYTSQPGEQDEEVLAPLETATLLLNGIERFQTRKGAYFTLGNPWATFAGSYTSAGIYAYGFGIQSGLDDPTGTLNFSRIDSAVLRVRTKQAIVNNVTTPGNVTVATMCATASNVLSTMYVWAPNYNVLRIMSGMGGMAYAN